MARSSGVPSNQGSIVSLPESSPDTDADRPQSGLDEDSEEILKPDFLEGIADGAANHYSSSDSDDDDDEDSKADDEPTSQLLREASVGRSPASSHKRTDEESAALLNYALSSHGRGPAPLPPRSERRRTSREGRSADSTPRRNNDPPRLDVYDLPPDPTPTPPSAQFNPHLEDDKQEERQPRRSTRTTSKQEQEEAQAVPGAKPDVETKPEMPKKKRGRPKKNPEAVPPSPKRQKASPANTGRRRSKGQEGGGSQENVFVETISTRRVTASSSVPTKTSATTRESSGKQQRTSSARLSQIRASSTQAQTEPESEEIPDIPEDTATDNEEFIPHKSQESNDNLDGLDGLQEVLKSIWTDDRGIKKIRRQRRANELRLKNDSAKKLVDDCQDFVNELKDTMEKSTELTEWEVPQVKRTISNLERDINGFNLENKEEVRNFLFQDLYAYIFPCLLRTLCKIVDFNVEFFSRDGATVQAPRLKELVNFTSAIINLGDRAKTSQVKVNSDLVIVRPTRDYILAPLKRFHHSLRNLLRHQTRQDEHRQAIRMEHKLLERVEMRRQREAAEEASRRAFWEDWRLLHLQRKGMEPDSRRWHHLDWRHPSASQQKVIRDIDANGEPFDRLVIFNHTRNSAEMPQDVVGVDWTDRECLTLMEGLKEYTEMDPKSPRYQVYRKIIRRNCGPAGILRRFNVSEIVQKSMYLKRMLPDSEWAQRVPTFSEIPPTS